MRSTAFCLVFHMGSRLQVVFSHYKRFPNNTMLTEFAKQHLTWWTEVVQKLLSSVFRGKEWVSQFFVFFLLAALHCFGEQRGCFESDARAVPHISDPPADVLPSQKRSSFSLKQTIQSNNVQFHNILWCSVILWPWNSSCPSGRGKSRECQKMKGERETGARGAED